MGGYHGTLLTLISFVAGAIVAFSSLPALIAVLFPRYGLRQGSGDLRRAQRLRNIALASGNALWVVYGVGAGAPAIVLFCGINYMIVTALIWKERRHQ